MMCVLKKIQVDRQLFTCDQSALATVDPFRDTMNQMRSQSWPHFSPQGIFSATICCYQSQQIPCEANPPSLVPLVPHRSWSLHGHPRPDPQSSIRQPMRNTFNDRFSISMPQTKQIESPAYCLHGPWPMAMTEI